MRRLPCANKKRWASAFAIIALVFTVGTPLYAAEPQPQPVHPILNPAPPNAPPRFVNVWVSQTVVHGGDVLHAHIRTTSNVASVEVRVANLGISLPRDDFGSFWMNYTVPRLPFFFHGKHDIEIIARNAAGAAVSIWRTFDLE